MGGICLLHCHHLQWGWDAGVPHASSLCRQGRKTGHNSSDPKGAILYCTCKATVREGEGLGL